MFLPLLAVAGATDAARGAADIVLTQPGLSAIITAIIGARKVCLDVWCSCCHGGRDYPLPVLQTNTGAGELLLVALFVCIPTNFLLHLLAPFSLQIFQRMTTYAKYTIAMTFRICFTFGLLTVIYNWWAGLRGWVCVAGFTHTCLSRTTR